MSSVVEERIQIVKKYGVIGVLALSFPFVEPIVSKYISDMTTRKFAGIVKQEIYDCSSKENKLQSDMVLKVSRYAVGKQSIHKVEAIRNILKTYDVKNKSNHHRIKIAIRNELYRQSRIYVNFLNNLAPYPTIGYVGTYIEDNFDMSVFLDNIYTIVLKTDCSTDTVATDVMNYMLEVQNVFFDQMEKDMKK